MKHPKKWRSLIATGALAAVVSTVLVANAGEAAQTPPQGAHHGPAKEWVGSWAAAVTRGNLSGSTFEGLNNQSVRMIVHGSVGGSKVRIRLSNLHGEKSVTVGRATVAKPNTSTPELSDIDPRTTKQLTFNGSTSFVMQKGAELLSDPVDLKVGNDEDLVVSVFFPTSTGLTTFHSTTRQSNFVGAGDLVSDPGGAGYTTERTCCWFFLAGVDVLRDHAAGSVIVFSDSLADGHGTTFNGNMRWPDQLFDRLQSKVRDRDLPGVLNISRGGARLNHEAIEPGDGGFPGFPELGDNALSRLNEDVFSETGAHTVIVSLGVNDIWMNNDSADAVIASLRQLNQQIQSRGYRTIFATIGPFKGLSGGTDLVWTQEKEDTRQAVNQYLRTHRPEFGTVVDFDKVVRDPADPTKIKAEYDPGDHIHPNDLGSKALAEAIPLQQILR